MTISQRPLTPQRSMADRRRGSGVSL